MSNETKDPFIGPVTIDAVVHLVSQDGRTAKVTVGLAPGRPITRDDILRAIGQAAEAGDEHGMKPMGPSTFFNYVLVREKTGRIGNFATPASMEYDLEGAIEYQHKVAHDEVDYDDDFEDDEE